jgi:hypothetical protein
MRQNAISKRLASWRDSLEQWQIRKDRQISKDTQHAQACLDESEIVKSRIWFDRRQYSPSASPIYHRVTFSESMRSSCWNLVLGLALLAGWLAPAAWGSDQDGVTIGSRDAQFLVDCATQLDSCLRQIGQLQTGNRKHAGYLLPRDHDSLELSFGAYLRSHDELRQIAERQKTVDADLSRAALRVRTQKDLRLASVGVKDAVLGRALNQTFHRSGIARGTFDRILHDVTAIDPSSVAEDDQKRLNDLIQRRGVIWPSLENDLRHVQHVQYLFEIGSAVTTPVRRGQGVLMAATGRIKNPTARPLAFTEEQLREIRSQLRPGDIVLTYTEGCASNFVIPGTFKHAVTFIGTEEERLRMGMTPEFIVAAARPNNVRLPQTLAITHLKNGKPADVVEAIAEGVLLANFEELLATRVNRMLVLRTRLDEFERAGQIADLLSFVGGGFDFSFDLTDASEQVCTELIYRTVQGRGGIDLPLSRHAGRITLTGDEILRYGTREGRERFSCVLIVDESPQVRGAARIVPATEAPQWILRATSEGM